jgi:hypothetical protein
MRADKNYPSKISLTDENNFLNEFFAKIELDFYILFNLLIPKLIQCMTIV